MFSLFFLAVFLFSLITVAVFTSENVEPCKQVLDLMSELIKQEQFKKVKCFTVSFVMILELLSDFFIHDFFV